RIHTCTHLRLHAYISMLFLFYSRSDHRHLHSFPTRRSSDLLGAVLLGFILQVLVLYIPFMREAFKLQWLGAGDWLMILALGILRSEEHTSELQSRENLVCRLLLEKKKTTSKRKNMKNESIQF